MENLQNRHDLSDAQWYRIEPIIKERLKTWGGSTGRGLNSKIYLTVDAHGMPVRIIVTEGTRADCKLAVTLMEGILVENAFLKPKRWRGVATRYAKSLSAFVGAVHLAAIVL